jgi:hypothetical protein
MAVVGVAGLRWLLAPLGTALLVTAITEAPYAAARRAAPPGHSFGGVVILPEDLHVYFGFARQAAEGHWLFVNPFTHLLHRPTYFNPEWLVAGWAMRVFGDPGFFWAWRTTGALILLGAFWALASIALPRPRQRLLALGLFAFGGGFAFLGVAAGRLGWGPALVPVPPGLANIDLDWGIHPFVQVLNNPHFTVPHGLVLLAFALFLWGERTGRTDPYVAAGAVSLLACMSRSYDALTFGLVIPLFHLLSRERREPVWILRRAIPLLTLAPVVLQFLVVRSEPAFRGWLTQGVMPVLPVSSHLLGLGLPAAVLVWRVIRERGLPFAHPTDRLLALWAAVAVLLPQANRLTQTLAFSPQMVVTGMAPLILLGVPALVGPSAKSPRGISPRWRFGAGFKIALVLMASLPSSALALKDRWNGAQSPHLQVSSGERLAWSWLAARAQPQDVILASATSGSRLPRYVSAQVVVGHWALTPDFLVRYAETLAFFSGTLSPAEAQRYLGAFRVSWIWVGQAEKSMGNAAAAAVLAGCELRHKGLGVRIYRCGEGRATPYS